MASRRRKSLEMLRSEHQQASLEHAAWKRDVERWRISYHQALRACAQRLSSGLELESFEAALDRHEAAMAAHEEALRRHETTLGLERRVEIGLSDDSLDFHQAMESRHARSKASHEQLERSHRAILAALEMLGRR
ncbi:MAG: hypothetical protein GY769_03595 [bacterium]|nr:hypothetical protein [bacterium]